MTSIQAIETSYKGYRFRSRLEARWAIFFDALGWEWLYELQGFDLPSNYYLPDFLVFMPRSAVWVEIKPSISLLSQKEYAAVIQNLVELTMLPIGDPPIEDRAYASFLLFGTPGEQVNPGVFITRPVDPATRHPAASQVAVTYHMAFAECPLCHDACLLLLPGADRGATLFCFCDEGRKITIKPGVFEQMMRTPRIMEAYDTARSARFEHGETPKVPRGKPKGGAKK